jgi:hypothetical protein
MSINTSTNIAPATTEVGVTVDDGVDGIDAMPETRSTTA